MQLAYRIALLFLCRLLNAQHFAEDWALADLTSIARQLFTNGVLIASSSNGSPQIVSAAHKRGRP
jgi:hypothetical protein